MPQMPAPVSPLSTEGLLRTPLLGPIAGAMIQAVKNAKDAVDGGDIGRLGHEVQRQELALRMAELQARVAQELAIAQRIESAAEVEIEEYYEAGGEGSIGFRPGPGGGVVGGSASARRVSKRVFRFIGTRETGSLPAVA
jgi:hypothetical protein